MLISKVALLIGCLTCIVADPFKHNSPISGRRRSTALFYLIQAIDVVAGNDGPQFRHRVITYGKATETETDTFTMFRVNVLLETKRDPYECVFNVTINYNLEVNDTLSAKCPTYKPVIFNVHKLQRL